MPLTMIDLGAAMSDVAIDDGKAKVELGHIDKDLKWPFRMGVIGPSNSGKTHLVINLLLAIGMDNITVYTAGSEPLYSFLKDQMSLLGVETNVFHLDEIIPLNELDDTTSKIVIFDDFISASTAVKRKMVDYAIRSRKFNISCIFISQTYRGIAKAIRLQLSDLILFHLASAEELGDVIKQHSSDPKAFRIQYDKLTSKKFGHLWIRHDGSISSL